MLFPSTTANGGSALISAKQEIPIPEHSWFAFDQEQGTERVWLVWSAHGVAELEAVKRLANPKDKGVISNPGQIKALEEFLTKYSASKLMVEKDEVNRQTILKGKSDVLVDLIRLEHH